TVALSGPGPEPWDHHCLASRARRVRLLPLRQRDRLHHLSELSVADLEPELCDRGAGRGAGGAQPDVAADPAAVPTRHLPRQVRGPAAMEPGPDPRRLRLA